jgi:hypothetical protein
MHRIKLEVRTGEAVGCDPLIPVFNPPADAVLWGERLFVYHREEPDGTRVYREGMAWVVPAEQVAESVERAAGKATAA